MKENVIKNIKREMILPIGKYKTENGSTMVISGKYGGISEVAFDWLEEKACIDCQPEPYADDGYLIWHCNICGGGKAKWITTNWRVCKEL